MYIVLIVLSIIASVLLVGVVLIQKSKGGGLSSSFAGSNQIMGVRRTNSFIEKVTWTLAGALALFAIISTFVMPGAMQNGQSRVSAPAAVEQTQSVDYSAPAPVETPATPAETPAAPVAE